MLKLSRMLLAAAPVALVIFAGFSLPAAAQSRQGASVHHDMTYSATAQPADPRNSASRGGTGYTWN